MDIISLHRIRLSYGAHARSRLGSARLSTDSIHSSDIISEAETSSRGSFLKALNRAE